MKYSIVIYYDSKERIYAASVPELDGCMAHGKTQEEALREIQSACELQLEVMRDNGDPIPEPSDIFRVAK